MNAVGQSLPRWDVSVIYPGLESAEFEHDLHSLISSIANLSELLDAQGTARQDPTAPNEADVRDLESILHLFSRVVEMMTTLESYISSFIMTDSRSDLAQAKSSEFEQVAVLLSQCETRFTTWIGSLDVDALISRSEVARQHAFVLQRTKVEATHLMTHGEEDLAMELGLTGSSAWSSLYDNLTSQLMVQIELDGQEQVLPMTVVRSMSDNPDREKRQRAYHAEQAAWKQVELPLTAALNSIKGEISTLSTRRGWHSPLDLALFSNNIDHQTLDAMLQVARESLPDFQRYLRAKARALGVPVLAWYDLYAPVGSSARSWDFGEATTFILEHFGAYSEPLRELAARALRDQWIDAEPREGKVGGAFCIPMRDDESRILLNFTPSYDGMSTLAHELGHGYHNYKLASHPALLRTAPSTLAETASIFCQALVREAALARVGESEQLSIISESLQESCTLVANILARFLFEQRVFERRQQRELSTDEFRALTLETEQETFGDAVDGELLQPYAWASIPHFYFVGDPYYNFPYTFGFLFALGLFARYRQNPQTFTPIYDQLLASTGEADAASLCARFDIDIRAPGFWRDSIDIIRHDIDRFEALVDVGAATRQDQGK